MIAGGDALPRGGGGQNWRHFRGVQARRLNDYFNKRDIRVSSLNRKRPNDVRCLFPLLSFL